MTKYQQASPVPHNSFLIISFHTQYSGNCRNYSRSSQKKLRIIFPGDAFKILIKLSTNIPPKYLTVQKEEQIIFSFNFPLVSEDTVALASCKFGHEKHKQFYSVILSSGQYLNQKQSRFLQLRLPKKLSPLPLHNGANGIQKLLFSYLMLFNQLGISFYNNKVTQFYKILCYEFWIQIQFGEIYFLTKCLNQLICIKKQGLLIFSKIIQIWWLTGAAQNYQELLAVSLNYQFQSCRNSWATF